LNNLKRLQMGKQEQINKLMAEKEALEKKLKEIRNKLRKLITQP